MSETVTSALDDLTALEAFNRILDLVTGYRASAEAAGFSPTAAEQMALDLHHQLLITCFAARPDAGASPPSSGT